MIGYLLRRTLQALLTIACVVTAVAVLIRLVPGDPAAAIAGDQATFAQREQLRRALGLDRPVYEQVLASWGDVFNGTLGHSLFRPTSTVASLLSEVLPRTIELAAAAIAIAWFIAVPLGILAAARRRSIWDRSASTLAVLGLALPNIWLGPLLILAFSVKLRWLPMPGDDTASTGAALLLPAITLGAALAAILTRQTRASMAETLSEQYVLAARARGVGTLRLLFRHALRNALFPVMTIGAAQLGALLSGTVVAERVFERPGLGGLLLDAFFQRDIPIIQGCVLLIATAYVSVNLFVDLLYAVVDPRLRLRR